MWKVVAVLVALAVAGPASARVFDGCTAAQAKVAGAALDGAQELALRGAAAVGDSRPFLQWFGPFSAAHGEEVRRGLKAIHATLAADGLRVVCLGRRAPDCQGGTFAFIRFDRPRAIHLCPSFFGMPVMVDALAGRAPIAYGTREGTIIHELSHFPFTADTRDDCYGREDCRDLAKRDPATAVGTADSFQYYAEDALLAFWLANPRAPLADAPAPR